MRGGSFTYTLEDHTMRIGNHYLSSLLLSPFPIRHVILYNLCCPCRTMLPADRFNKIPFWIYSTRHVSSANKPKRGYGRRKAKRAKPTHQVKINAMIDQIILSRLDALRCAEVYPIGFANLFYLLPRSCEADNGRMKFCKVGF